MEILRTIATCQRRLFIFLNLLHCFNFTPQLKGECTYILKPCTSQVFLKKILKKPSENKKIRFQILVNINIRK